MEKLKSFLLDPTIILFVITSIVGMIAWGTRLESKTNTTETKVEQHLVDAKEEAREISSLKTEMAVLRSQIDMLLPEIQKLNKHNQKGDAK